MYIIKVITEEYCNNKDNSLKRFNNIKNLASQPGRNYIRSACLIDNSTGEFISFFRRNTEQSVLERFDND